MTERKVLYDAHGDPINIPYSTPFAPRYTDPFRELTAIPGGMNNEWNPDHIVRYHSMGKGMRIYRDMQLDGHIYGLVKSRKNGVTSKKIKIVPYNKSPECVMHADFIKWVLFERVFKFKQDVKQILDSIFIGANFHEIYWEIAQWQKYPKENGYVSISKMDQVDPERFMFHWDQNLMVRGFGNQYPGKAAPDKRFLVSSYETIDENRYGNATLAKCYWYWWFKKLGMKFWSIFNEKFLMPTPVGRVPKGTSSDDRATFLKILQSLQTDFAAVMDEEFIVDFIQGARTSAGNSYESWLDFLNNEMSKAVLGQTTSTQNTASVGGKAEAQVGMEKENLFVQDDCEYFMDEIDVLIQWLIDYNFQEVEGYPHYKISHEPAKDINVVSNAIKTGYSIGLPLSKRDIYDGLNLLQPEQSEDGEFQDPDDVLTNPNPTGAIQGMGYGGQPGQDGQDQGFSSRWREVREFAKLPTRAGREMRDMETLINLAMETHPDLFESSLLGPIRDAVQKKTSLN